MGITDLSQGEYQMDHRHRFINDFDEFNSLKRIISEGYGQWVREQLDQDWDAYILTFMFRQIPGSRSSILATMTAEIERVYATMLTRIIRNPMSEKNRDMLPIWIGCPDFPVPKYQKQSLRNVTVNDGLHFHVICLIPPDSRLLESLEDHVAHHHQLYRGKVGTISELHVRRSIPDAATPH